MDRTIEIIESEIRQIFASVVWTHKIQEKQADIYLSRYNIFKNSKIILSAVTTSGICGVVFIDKYWLKVITAIISVLSLVINAYFKEYDLKSLQKQHKNSALQLLKLRNNIISVLCDIKIGRYDEESLLTKRNEILVKMHDVEKNCLDASNKAVDKASENLKARKDNTYSDDEIDSFLPILARKNNN
ncbi:SLATT domain-containing protein [Clostridium botulinum]|uniref:SLATT domain-containing protein n=1 Tax=Clostridium botulinum TaxID=1491 RepID=UPI001C9B2F16|nr:SLATT domain-containing protein [Clostridium botulinum]MBY6810800.1 SLATT domain-containing protein [Clostridium botulinum]MBY6824205.1 SLATT domain-containing protein [Clostridium botulinum]MBY6834659.1 SLATT domain-containing protein [Clostridium botulinum]MBY6973371.1 SLATT domain-containing protein [Clostridium botulinum]HBJ1651470.1 SLATT domain-containing protein [Clostridium botulinum]